MLNFIVLAFASKAKAKHAKASTIKFNIEVLLRGIFQILVNIELPKFRHFLNKQLTIFRTKVLPKYNFRSQQNFVYIHFVNELNLPLIMNLAVTYLKIFTTLHFWVIPKLQRK
jgi:hypothetical protein